MIAETPVTAMITAKQLRELNHHWHMLSALVNELGMARTMDDLMPKEQLAKIGELEQWARKRMSWHVPPSVVAEDRAREVERKRVTKFTNVTFKLFAIDLLKGFGFSFSFNS